MPYGPSFSLQCKRCDTAIKLDDYAIDPSCQNKHVFFFQCPDCGDFSATAMANIPQEQWKDFIPEDKLTEIQEKYNVAMKQND